MVVVVLWGGREHERERGEQTTDIARVLSGTKGRKYMSSLLGFLLELSNRPHNSVIDIPLKKKKMAITMRRWSLIRPANCQRHLRLSMIRSDAFRFQPQHHILHLTQREPARNGRVATC